MRRALALALLLAVVAVPVARADGDPASDYLLGQSTFIPPDAGISRSDQATLTAMLHSAAQQGYILKVAVIASAYDLGSVTVLDKRPKLYAPFLSQELKFLYKGRVLVVMQNGLAIAHDGKRDPAESKVVSRIRPPKRFQGAPLAAVTQRAVQELAANAGVHVTATPISSHGGSSQTRDRVVIGVVIVAVLAATLALSFWQRRGVWRRGRKP